MTVEALLKRALYEKCVEHITTRIQAIEKRLREVEESRNNETKSSVGDKYETGRSMMQMEEEKSKTQLHEAFLVKHRLSQLPIDKVSEKVVWGSLVICNQATYFLSIGIGKVEFNQRIYYCISNESPIGKVLLGKSRGDTAHFNEKMLVIENIV